MGIGYELRLQRRAAEVVNVGRPMLYPEHINLSLPHGAKAAMDAVLHDGEERVQMIREAIRKEVALREAALAKGGKTPNN